MKKIDVNVLGGHWPFRKLYKEGTACMRDYYNTEEVECGLMSSCDSIFFHDAFEGDEDLYQQIIELGATRMVMTVNPKVPGWQKDLEYECEHFHICAVKVLPQYHNYGLEDPDFNELVAKLEEKQLPLMLVMRMEDIRNSYLWPVGSLSTDSIRVLVKRVSIPVILLHALVGEVQQLADLLDGRHHFFVDTSGMRGATFPIEELLQSVSDESILYGTSYPLLSEKASVYIIEKAMISDETKEKLFYGNAKKLFCL